MSLFVLVRVRTVGTRSWLKILIFFIIYILSIGSCTRSYNAVSNTIQIDNSGLITWSGAVPAAILKTGEYPLWFQLTQDGPVYIESIEDAVDTIAFTPWPYALHISSITESGSNLVMAINRDGFLLLSPGIINVQNIQLPEDQSIVMYRFPGGEIWRLYTVGGFVLYDGNPVAVLYLDNRFMNSNLLQPRPGIWSFNMNSNIIFPLVIPALQLFPEEEDWGIDTLRLGADGFYYYRAVKRDSYSQITRMYRTTNLAQSGNEISAEVFFGSAVRQTVFSHPSLPLLPDGFVYTGIAEIGDSLFASWEEQADYSIGAAGFMLIMP